MKPSRFAAAALPAMATEPKEFAADWIGALEMRDQAALQACGEADAARCPAGLCLWIFSR